MSIEHFKHIYRERNSLLSQTSTAYMGIDDVREYLYELADETGDSHSLIKCGQIKVSQALKEFTRFKSLRTMEDLHEALAKIEILIEAKKRCEEIIKDVDGKNKNFIQQESKNMSEQKWREPTSDEIQKARRRHFIAIEKAKHVSGLYENSYFAKIVDARLAKEKKEKKQAAV